MNRELKRKEKQSGCKVEGWMRKVKVEVKVKVKMEDRW